MPSPTATLPDARRSAQPARPASAKKGTPSVPAMKPGGKRPVQASSARKGGRPPLAPTHIKVEIDWSRSDAFLRLPMEERERRTEAFRAALAPAFADYSSDDFRADQRREAERD